MAHYAKLGANNKVIAVEVVADKDCQNADGIEDEEVGRQFLERIHSWPLWKKTSYNTLENVHLLGGTPYRINFAAIGDTYDSSLDGFIKSKPNDKPSWVLNTTTGTYEPPTPMPEQQENGDGWLWDESTTSWVSNPKTVI